MPPSLRLPRAHHTMLGAASILAADGLQPAPVSHLETNRQAISLQASLQTNLGQAHQQLRAQAQADPAHSGFYALDEPREALPHAAYWHARPRRRWMCSTTSGATTKRAICCCMGLLMAADRGVRVRLLLDDGGTSGLDDALLALHQHPNAEVRIFNPFVLRGLFKKLGYVTEFSRNNRRMHNKSFSADGQANVWAGAMWATNTWRDRWCAVCRPGRAGHRPGGARH